MDTAFLSGSHCLKNEGNNNDRLCGVQRSILPFLSKNNFYIKITQTGIQLHSLLRGHDPFLNTPARSVVNLITI